MKSFSQEDLLCLVLDVEKTWGKLSAQQIQFMSLAQIDHHHQESVPVKHPLVMAVDHAVIGSVRFTKILQLQKLNKSFHTMIIDQYKLKRNWIVAHQI